MYRQSSVRNHRSKGIKVRHVLQICLLLAVCFWLMYQVKRSHEKKKEFVESDDVKASLERMSSNEVPRLGRKDIHSREEETTYSNKDDKSDERIREEEDENKLEKDEVVETKIGHKVDSTKSHEKANAEGEDEASEGENEETDEHERDGSDTEMERGEEFVDDEKEREADDNVDQESDGEKIRIEKENESDSDGVGKSTHTHDAHEEHYMADDASSAVSQDTREKPSAENENAPSKEENKGSDDAEGTDKVENRTDLVVEASKDDKESNITTTSDINELILDNSDNGSPPNGTVAQGPENGLPPNGTVAQGPENGSPPNGTVAQGPENGVTQGFDGNFTSYNSTEVALNDLSLLNVTKNNNMLDFSLRDLDKTTSNEVSISDTNASELMNNSRLNVNNNGLDDSNSTRDSELKTESAAEKIVTSEEASAETRDNTQLSPKVKDETESERSDTNNEGLGGVEHESIDISDSSNTLEETDVRKDTVPVIKSEGVHEDDSAAG